MIKRLKGTCGRQKKKSVSSTVDDPCRRRGKTPLCSCITEVRFMLYVSLCFTLRMRTNSIKSMTDLLKLA